MINEIDQTDIGTVNDLNVQDIVTTPNDSVTNAARVMGRKGGLAVLDKYGKNHFAKLGAIRPKRRKEEINTEDS